LKWGEGRFVSFKKNHLFCRSLTELTTGGGARDKRGVSLPTKRSGELYPQKLIRKALEKGRLIAEDRSVQKSLLSRNAPEASRTIVKLKEKVLQKRTTPGDGPSNTLKRCEKGLSGKKSCSLVAGTWGKKTASVESRMKRGRRPR